MRYPSLQRCNVEQSISWVRLENTSWDELLGIPLPKQLDLLPEL
jgi:hypothetical protein